MHNDRAQQILIFKLLKEAECVRPPRIDTVCKVFPVNKCLKNYEEYLHNKSLKAYPLDCKKSSVTSLSFRNYQNLLYNLKPSSLQCLWTGIFLFILKRIAMIAEERIASSKYSGNQVTYRLCCVASSEKDLRKAMNRIFLPGKVLNGN